MNDYGIGKATPFESANNSYVRKQEIAAALGASNGQLNAARHEDGLLTNALGLLRRPSSAVVGGFTAALGLKDEADTSLNAYHTPLSRAWAGLSGHQMGWGDFSGLKTRKDDGWLTRGAKMGAAFGLDMVTDPTTYLTGGTGALGRQGATVAAEAYTRSLAPKLFDAAKIDATLSSRLEALGAGHLDGLRAKAAAKAATEAGDTDAAAWATQQVTETLNHRGLQALVAGAEKADPTLKGAAKALQNGNISGLTNFLTRKVGPDDASKIVAGLTGRTDEIAHLGEVAATTDALAYGAGQAVLQGGTRGLRTFLVTHLGEEAGSAAFKAAPSQLRGGLGVRVPFSGINPATGERGFRAPIFGDKNLIPDVLSVGGGGQILGKSEAGTRLMDAANLARLGVQASAPVRAVGDKLGGRLGSLYGGAVKDAYTDEAARVLGGSKTVGKLTGVYDDKLAGALAAKAAGDGKLAGLAGAAARTFSPTDERNGTDDLTRHTYGQWSFLKGLQSDLAHDAGRHSSADQRALATVRHNLKAAETKAGGGKAGVAQVQAFSTDLFSDRAAFEKLNRDSLTDWQKDVYDATAGGYKLLDSWGGRLFESGFDHGDVEHYLPLIATAAMQDLAKRRAAGVAGRGAKQWKPTKGRDSYFTVARDSDGKVVLNADGTVKMSPRSAADINAELKEAGRAPKFEDDMLTVLSAYGAHANKAVGQVKMARRLKDSGFLVTSPVLERITAAGPVAVNSAVAAATMRAEKLRDVLGDEVDDTRHRAAAIDAAAAARDVERASVRTGAEADAEQAKLAAETSRAASTAAAAELRQAHAAEAAAQALAAHIDGHTGGVSPAKLDELINAALGSRFRAGKSDRAVLRALKGKLKESNDQLDLLERRQHETRYRAARHETELENLAGHNTKANRAAVAAAKKELAAAQHALSQHLSQVSEHAADTEPLEVAVTAAKRELGSAQAQARRAAKAKPAAASLEADGARRADDFLKPAMSAEEFTRAHSSKVEPAFEEFRQLFQQRQDRTDVGTQASHALHSGGTKAERAAGLARHNELMAQQAAMPNPSEQQIHDAHQRFVEAREASVPRIENSDLTHPLDYNVGRLLMHVEAYGEEHLGPKTRAALTKLRAAESALDDVESDAALEKAAESAEKKLWQTFQSETKSGTHTAPAGGADSYAHTLRHGTTAPTAAAAAKGRPAPDGAAIAARVDAARTKLSEATMAKARHETVGAALNSRTAELTAAHDAAQATADTTPNKVAKNATRAMRGEAANSRRAGHLIDDLADRHAAQMADHTELQHAITALESRLNAAYGAGARYQTSRAIKAQINAAAANLPTLAEKHTAAAAAYTAARDTAKQAAADVRKAAARYEKVTSAEWAAEHEARATRDLPKLHAAREKAEAELAEAVLDPAHIAELGARITENAANPAEAAGDFIKAAADLKDKLKSHGAWDASLKATDKLISKDALLVTEPGTHDLLNTGLTAFASTLKNGELRANTEASALLANTFASREMMRIIDGWYAPAKAWDNKLWNSFLRPYMTLWKTYATVGRGPGFTIRNVVGGVWNQMLHGLDVHDVTATFAIVKAEEAARAQAWKEARAAAGGSKRELKNLLRYSQTRDAIDYNALEARTAELIENALKGKRHGQVSLHEIYTARQAHNIIDTSSTNEVLFTAGQASPAEVHAAHDALLDGRPLNPMGLAGPGGDGQLGIGGTIASRLVDNAYIRTMARGNELAEKTLRTMTFARGAREFGLADGGSMATQLVKALQFDYADLSDFEAKWLKTLIPFYAWSRNNIPLQVRVLAHEPGKITGLDHAQEALQNGFGADGDQADLPLNGNVEAAGGFVTRFKIGDNNVSTYLPIPTYDLNSMLHGNGIPDLTAAVGQLNPALKSAIGSGMGVDPGTRAALNPDGTSAPLPVQALKYVPGNPFDVHTNANGDQVANSGWVSAFRNLVPGYSTANNIVAPTTDNARQRWLTSTLSSTLGAPVQTITPEQSTAMLLTNSKKYDTLIKRLEGQQGLDRQKVSDAASQGIENLLAQLAAGQLDRDDS